MSNAAKDLRDVLMGMSDLVIGFHSVYAKIAGSAGGGVFLSQAMFLSSMESVQRDNGWFFHTYDQWWREASLARRELDSIRRRLRSIEWDGQPLMEEERKGQPAQLFYRINQDVLVQLILAIQSGRSVQTGENMPVVDVQSSLETSDKLDSRERSNLNDRRCTDLNDRRCANIESTKKENIKEYTKEYRENTPADAGPPSLSTDTDTGPSTDPVPEPEPEQPPTPAPERTYTDDQLAFGLAWAYYRAMGVDRKQVPKGTVMKTKNTFKPIVQAYDEEDVRGCVGYMRSDPWWREPGRLTPGKVLDTLPEWVASGRPEARAPNGKASGYGTSNAVTGDGWRAIAQQLRERGE